MIVELDPSSPLPPYEQLRQQIAHMITSGVLAPETRLPSIRRLAADLGMAPGTVARAYRELETARLVVTAGRRGTRVSTPDTWSHERTVAEVARRLREGAQRYATLARQLGATHSDALAHIEEALADEGSEREPTSATN